MATTQLVSRSSSIASFEVLVRKVKQTFLLGRQRVRREMVRTYWQAGQYIDAHLLCHRERADYGNEVIPKLAERVDYSESSLRRMLMVYREFPKIPSSMTELDLTHLYALASIPDKEMRYEFAKRAAEKKWNTREPRSKIKTELRPDSKNAGLKFLPFDPESLSPLKPKLGMLYTYRLVQTQENGPLKIDQGFRVYRTEFDLHGRFKAGEIVESRLVSSPNVFVGDPKEKKNWIPARLPARQASAEMTSKHYQAVKSERGEEDLFTYKASVERVVDGDTLFVEVDLGFTNTTRQYLRLRSLDAPEMTTEKGHQAKSFVQSLLKEAPFIILTSTRSDKYDRYLADVFIPGQEFLKEWNKGTARLSKSGDLLYLNNALLTRHHAVRMS